MANTGVATGDPNKVIEMKIKATLAEMDGIKRQLQDLADWFATHLSTQVIKQVKEETAGLEDKDPTTNKRETKTASESRERDAKHMEKIRASLNTIADVGVGFIKKTFGLVEMVYNQLKKSSPLLQAIEQLFNLAWMLFFMPLGNKLGEMLIPAVIQLVDDVMDIWDAFEGKTLDEMLSIAIEKGVNMLGDFIEYIGKTLSSQKGFVGSIASMLIFIGDFLRENGEKVLNSIASLASFILTHLKEIIALIVAFKAMSYTMSMMQIVATYASESFLNKISGGTLGLGMMLGTSLVVGGVAGVGSYGIMQYAGMKANGGYIPSTPGGQLVTVGEGGEGEYIIPESKMGSVGDRYTINNYCYTESELKRVINDVLSDNVSAARLRSGF